MTEDDRATLATINVELRHLRDDVEELSTSLKTSAGIHVTRSEWQLRNAHVDSVHSALGREIGILRADIASRRAPWPTIVAAFAAVVAAAVSLIINL